MTKYNIEWDWQYGTREATSISVFGGDEPYVVTPTHPNFLNILEGVETGVDDEEIQRLYDVGLALSDKFDRLSERVTVNNGRVFFDGIELKNALTDRILNFLRQGLDFKPLVLFMENVMNNPNDHSRDNLFRWLESHRFSLTTHGTFVAYKGLTSYWHSSSSGTAIVDDEIVHGQIPNRIGSVIEMDRSQVQHDPANGCSTGLHAATWDFARGFGSIVVMVDVNPRDVVSVPTDSNDQKLRVCRYKVIAEVFQEDTSELISLDPTDSNDQKLRVGDRVIRPKSVKTKKKAKSKKPAKYDNTEAKNKYTQFRREDFDDLVYDDFKKVAKEFGETKVMARDRKAITDRLVRRTRDWRRG